jgi:hypothetical protein
MKEKTEQSGATWDKLGNVWRNLDNGTFELASLGFECGENWCLYVWDEEFDDLSDCPEKTLNFEEARKLFSEPVYKHGEVIGFSCKGEDVLALWVPEEHTVGFPLGGE